MHSAKSVYFLTLLLALVSVDGWSQAKPTLSDLPGGFQVQSYYGNPIRIRIDYPSGVGPVTNTLYLSKGGKKAPLQAAVLDSSSTSQILYWPNSSRINDKSWLEIKIDGKVSAAGELSVGYGTNSSVPRRDTIRFVAGQSQTLQIVVNGNGPSTGGGGSTTPGGGDSNTQTRFFVVGNVSNGYVMTHNLNSRLVVGYSLRSDTGQIDDLWKVEAATANTAVLRGPTTEVFSGTIVLRVFLNAN